TVVGHIVTGQRPRAVVFAADGNTAFVSNEMGRSVTVIDARQNTATGSITIEDVAGARQRPMGVALSRDARQLYVTTGGGAAVAAIGVAKGAAERSTAGVGARPWGIAVSRDGRRLFTANGTSDDLSIIDAATGKVERRVKVGKLPWGVAVAD